MLMVIILLSFPPVSCAAVHSLKYFYTCSSGISGFPEFIAVGYVDGIKIMYYDSATKEAVPKQEWMKTVGLDDAYWQMETEVAMDYEQTFKADMSILKERFSQIEGVHVFQKMYSCWWDNETGATGGFEQFGYDGEDFISLDLKNMMWIAAVYQAFPTRNKWNSNELAFPDRRNYFNKNCVDWLKKYLQYGNNALRAVPPEVSLLQKDTEVVCHATGFYPEAVNITWKRDGVEMDDDVDVGDTLPNGDGTFQKRVVLTVSPEERKKANYTCEVTHKNGRLTVKIFKEVAVALVAGIGIPIFFLLVTGVAVACRIKRRGGRAIQDEGLDQGEKGEDQGEPGPQNLDPATCN